MIGDLDVGICYMCVDGGVKHLAEQLPNADLSAAAATTPCSLCRQEPGNALRGIRSDVGICHDCLLLCAEYVAEHPGTSALLPPAPLPECGFCGHP